MIFCVDMNGTAEETWLQARSNGLVLWGELILILNVMFILQTIIRSINIWEVLFYGQTSAGRGGPGGLHSTLLLANTTNIDAFHNASHTHYTSYEAARNRNEYSMQGVVVRYLILYPKHPNHSFQSLPVSLRIQTWWRLMFLSGSDFNRA